MNRQNVKAFTIDYYKRFEDQLNKLHLNKTQIVVFLGACYNSVVTNWKKQKRPCFTSDMIVKMISVGMNPIYCFGHGNITLEGFQIEDVFQNITKELERIYQERRES